MVERTVADNGAKRDAIALVLFLALMEFPFARLLRSDTGNDNLVADIVKHVSSNLISVVELARIIPLLRAVIEKRPDEEIWDSVYYAVAEPPTRAT